MGDTPDVVCAAERIARCRFQLDLTSLTRRWTKGTNCASGCPSNSSNGIWTMLDQPIVSAGFTGPVVLSGNGKMMASLQALGQFYSNIDVYELNKDEEWSLSQSIDADQGYGFGQPAFSDDGSRLVVVDEVSVTVAGNKRFVCRARVLARD